MNLLEETNTFPYEISSFENSDYGGIYFVYDNKKLLYIGQSNNIGYRISCYIRKQSHLHFPTATHVEVLKVSDKMERLALESNLIKEYLPPMNYSGTGGKSERCLKIPKKFNTAISLDKDIYEKVKAVGEKEDRSFSQQVNKILKEYLKGREE